MWKRIQQLFRRPQRPTPEEIAAAEHLRADQQAAKDRWLADEARQSRQSTNIGG